MKIKVHAQLLWQEDVWWLVSEKPRFVENRPNHDRYDVVPYQDYILDPHMYIRFMDVPKGEYAVMGTKEYESEIKDD